MSNTNPTLIVALYIKGYDLNPSIVTRLLGIEPTRSSYKGEKKITDHNKEVVSKSGFWVLASNVESYVVSDHLSFIKSSVESGIKDIFSVAGVEEAFVDVFVAAPSNDVGEASFSFILSERDVASLGEIGLTIKVTITSGPD